MRGTPCGELVERPDPLDAVPLDHGEQHGEPAAWRDQVGDAADGPLIGGEQSGQQRSPGELHPDPVGHARELWREVLGRRHDEQSIGELRLLGATESVVQAGGVGVDADDEARGIGGRRSDNESPIAGTDIDDDPTMGADQVSESADVELSEASVGDHTHGLRLRPVPDDVAAVSRARPTQGRGDW